MSREQWGHGYWQGVRDAQSNNVGTAKQKTEDLVYNAIRFMWKINQRHENDQSLYGVSGLIFDTVLLYDLSWKQAERIVKKVYDYVLNNDEPWGCYITGSADSNWKEDCFVLPSQIPERSENGN